MWLRQGPVGEAEAREVAGTESRPRVDGLGAWACPGGRFGARGLHRCVFRVGGGGCRVVQLRAGVAGPRQCGGQSDQGLRLPEGRVGTACGWLGAGTRSPPGVVGGVGDTRCGKIVRLPRGPWGDRETVKGGEQATRWWGHRELQAQRGVATQKCGPPSHGLGCGPGGWVDREGAGATVGEGGHGTVTLARPREAVPPSPLSALCSALG